MSGSGRGGGELGEEARPGGVRCGGGAVESQPHSGGRVGQCPGGARVWAACPCHLIKLQVHCKGGGCKGGKG